MNKRKKNKNKFLKIAVIAILLGAFMLKNSEEIKKRLLSEPAIKKKQLKKLLPKKLKRQETTTLAKGKKCLKLIALSTLLI